MYTCTVFVHNICWVINKAICETLTSVLNEVFFISKNFILTGTNESSESKMYEYKLKGICNFICFAFNEIWKVVFI